MDMSTKNVVSRDVFSPPAEGEIRLARMSPDGARIAFFSDDGVEPAVCVWEIGAEDTRRIAPLRDAAVDELRWSPSGEHLAYLAGSALPTGFERSVGWTSTNSTAEIGRVDGAAFAWSASKPALIVADLRRRGIMHINLETRAELRLGEVIDDGDVACPPAIALPSGGEQIAFTCRQMAAGRAEVWVLTRDKEGIEPTLITQIPGTDVRVRPLWSPKGRTLAMHIVHPPLQRSALIALPHLKGDGIVLQTHDLCDAVQTPAWSPSGRYIAMFIATTAGSEEQPIGEQQLALVDTQARTLQGLGEATSLGPLRFLDDRRLVIDGGEQVELLTLDGAV